MRVLRMDHGRLGGSQLAALATNGEAELWCGVERVFEELDLNGSGAGEDAFVDGTNVFRAAADAPQEDYRAKPRAGVGVFLHEL